MRKTESRTCFGTWLGGSGTAALPAACIATSEAVGSGLGVPRTASEMVDANVDED
jgi:hypothetical protein